jgi:hypothetical protein
MPMLKKRQVELLQRLITSGVPGETASIVGAACYDQKRLSSRFYGAPRLSEAEARVQVERWLQQHPTGPNYTSATDENVKELITSIFGPP